MLEGMNMPVSSYKNSIKPEYFWRSLKQHFISEKLIDYSKKCISWFLEMNIHAGFRYKNQPGWALTNEWYEKQ
jgi:hypothetical protein